MSDDFKDDFMAAAWGGFISWAIGEPEIIAQFEEETGLHFPKPARTPFDAAIDNACGVTVPAGEFTKWATVNLWGLDEAPQSYRDAVAQGTA